MFSAVVLVMSALPIWAKPLAEVFWPVKALALLLPVASPDATLLSRELLRASTDVRPDETTPVTCPPTASPDFELPPWVPVDRLLPDWTLVPVAFVTSARARPADQSAPPTVNTATSSVLRARFI